MAKHFAKKKYHFLFILLIFCVLIILGIIIYLYIIPHIIINSNNKNTIINCSTATTTIFEPTSTTYKIFEGVPHLQSDKFELTVSNGISRINGKIFNTSNDIINDLNCLYTLKDISGNTVYEFTIYAKEIKPQDYFGFTSVVLLDLTDVDDYSVKLFNNIQ